MSVLLLGFNLRAQTIEKSRIINKTFLVSPDAEIEIANKYGSIHLIPWKKDSVRFEIEIMVRGTKQAKVDKSYDYIEIDFKSSKYYLIAQTLFAGKSSFWSDVSDLTGAIFNSSTKTKIDYKVYVPQKSKLKMVNKYGNIYTTDHVGPIEIELSNGNLKAHHFYGKTKIKTEFADSDIKKIDNGQLNINYGEFHLEEAGNIEIESKSAKISINTSEQLILNSKRDKIYLQNAGSISGTTYFSLVEADQLGNKLGLSTKYGDIDIKSFSDEMESFNLKSVNTDVTLHFPDEKQYQMDIVVDEKTAVMYSAEIKNISSKELGGEEKLIQVKCKVGSENNILVPLDIDCRAGTLSLKLK
jgi:hypothetical protein